MSTHRIHEENECFYFVTFTCNAGGNRIKKLVRTTGGNFESVTYVDGIFEYHKKESGSTEEKNYSHIMDDKSRICMIRTGSFTGDPTDSVFYILEDHLVSSNVRLNNSGAVIDREEYYPFGDSSLRTWGKKRYRYVGKEKDNESGLYYYGMRYYAAWTCRFISVDPLAGSYANLTPYNNAGNKPIDFIDIDGMQGEGDDETPSEAGGETTHEVDKTPTRKITVYLNDIDEIYGDEFDIEDGIGLTDYKDRTRTDFAREVKSDIESTYALNDINITVKVKWVTKRPLFLSRRRVYFDVGNDDRRSHAQKGGNVGYLNISDIGIASDTAAHELGHMYGLSDRYNMWFQADMGTSWDVETDGTSMPMILNRFNGTPIDKEYVPGHTGFDNLMNGEGQELTSKQKRIFLSKLPRFLIKERSYKTYTFFTKNPVSDILYIVKNELVGYHGRYNSRRNRGGFVGYGPGPIDNSKGYDNIRGGNSRGRSIWKNGVHNKRRIWQGWRLMH